jgi:hypothetical protein
VSKNQAIIQPDVPPEKAIAACFDSLLAHDALRPLKGQIGLDFAAGTTQDSKIVLGCST